MQITSSLSMLLLGCAATASAFAPAPYRALLSPVKAAPLGKQILLPSTVLFSVPQGGKAPSVDAPWDEMFALLLQYKEREGHCRVRMLDKEGGESLGYWLRDQRALKSNGELDDELVEKLEEVGVAWSAADSRWDHAFSLLVSYKEREGDCNVPPMHQEEEEMLGYWMRDQSKLNRKGALDGSRKERLEELGIDWKALEKVVDDLY